MENVNTIELNGQLYDIEDATARTIAEQNSEELVRVKGTANNAQATATTAQESASTAQTTADEAKGMATTAQTAANEAKEMALARQPIFGKWVELYPDENNSVTITLDNIASIFRQYKNTFIESDIYYFIFGAEGNQTQSEIHLAVRMTQENFVVRTGAWSQRNFSITQAGQSTLTIHWETDTFLRAFLLPICKGKL